MRQQVPSHTACPSCGYYKGRQVLTVDAELALDEACQSSGRGNSTRL